jgi:hypothetical protein
MIRMEFAEHFNISIRKSHAPRNISNGSVEFPENHSVTWARSVPREDPSCRLNVHKVTLIIHIQQCPGPRMGEGTTFLFTRQDNIVEVSHKEPRVNNVSS